MIMLVLGKHLCVPGLEKQDAACMWYNLVTSNSADYFLDIKLQEMKEFKHMATRINVAVKQTSFLSQPVIYAVPCKNFSLGSN